MAYNPNLYMNYGQQSYPQPVPQMQPMQVPQQLQYVQNQQPHAMTGNFIVEVYGRQGAESLPLGPNSKIVAYDKNEDVAYNIQTDDAANKSIQEFDFFPREANKSANIAPGADYVTKADFDALAARVDQLEQKPRQRKANDGE